MLKMNPDLWKKVRYFTEQEKWGDPYKIDTELIYKLDKFRAIIEKPFTVHNAYTTSGHSKNSQHYSGKAVDGHVEKVDLLDIFLCAERIGFNGIGLYDWGVHLDVRNKSARWCRINGVYLSLNARNIDYLREIYKYK